MADFGGIEIDVADILNIGIDSDEYIDGEPSQAADDVYDRNAKLPYAGGKAWALGLNFILIIGLSVNFAINHR